MILDLFIQTASAQNFQTLSSQAGDASGAIGSLILIIGSLFNFLIGISGVIILIYIMTAGFFWMTAGGNPEQIKKAKSMLINGVIGLLIVIGSFAIATFIQGSIINPATGQVGVDTNTGAVNGSD